MTDKISMLNGLQILRNIVEGKNTLKPKDVVRYRAKVSDLADRCYFNSGWLTAAPDKKLGGSASTDAIWLDIYKLTEELSGFVKAPRKAGRPAKIKLGYLLVLAEFNSHHGDQSLRDCVRTVFKIPGALPEGQSVDTVTRHVERLLAKFRPAYERTKNVVQFCPKKSRRQNSKTNSVH